MDGEPLSIVVVGSPQPPRALPESGSLVIGSSREHAQLVLDAADVDAAHCAIGRLKEGGFALKDLGSKAGVELNGQRVTAARLKLVPAIHSRAVAWLGLKSPQAALDVLRALERSTNRIDSGWRRLP